MPSPTPSPRIERRRAETRDRIFEAALDLFMKQGIAGTTVAQIAEKADIGKGTFFTYFPTKEAVLHHLGHILMERMLAERAQVPKRAKAGAMISDVLLSACAWHEKNAALSAFVLETINADASRMESEERTNLGRFSAMLRELVKEGQARGELDRKMSPDAAAVALFGTYFAALHRWHTTQREGSLVAIIRSALAILLRGMRA